MLIERVALKNIKSYADEEIFFRPGVNFIKGANGAGKSTIIEAVGFAVFDVTKTGFSVSMQTYLLRSGEKAGSIEVDFSEGGDNYRVLRTVSEEQRERKWKIYKNGAEQTELYTDRDRCAYLESVLHISENRKLDSVFSQLIGVKQGRFKTAFEAAEADRREEFNRILGISEYKAAEKRVNEVKRLLSADIGKNDAAKNALLSTISDLGEKRERLKNGEKELVSLKASEKQAKERSSALNDIFALLSEVKTLEAEITAVKTGGEARIAEHRAGIAEAQKKAAQNALDTKRLEGAAAQAESAYKNAISILGALVKEIKSAERELSLFAGGTQKSYHNGKKQLEKRLDAARTEMEKVKNAVCPYLGVNCEKAAGAEIKDICAPIRAEAEAAEGKYIAALKEVLSINWRKAAQSFFAEAGEECAFCGTERKNNDIAALEAAFAFELKEAEKCGFQVGERYDIIARGALTAAEKAKNDVITSKKEALSIDAGIKKLQSALKKELDALEKLGEKERRADEITLALGENAKKDINAAREESAEAQRLLGEVSARRSGAEAMIADTKALIVKMEASESEIKRIESDTKALQKTLTGAGIVTEALKKGSARLAAVYTSGITAMADEMYREITGGAAALEFNLEYDACLVDMYKGSRRKISFNQLSGGQKMTAALCVRGAMIKCFSPVGIAFFDEPTENMDSLSKQRLCEAIRGAFGGFRQLFIISHDDAFDRLTENVIDLEGRADGTVRRY